ncbi:MAG TPA: hypothetical protein VM734_28785 [Kofleriaceae bacterium]|nr:hypothetical protein [Kofleriaceae bacterium]
MWFGRTASKDRRFWAWVADHVDELRAVTNARAPIMNQLADQLHKVHRGLALEVGLKMEPLELIISAEGQRKLFPVVERLIAAAPPIPRVRPVAFRPRLAPGFKIRIDGIELGPDDLWFTASVAGEGLDLTLYVRGLEDEDDETWAYVVFLVLQATLGEYDFETRVASFEMQPAPAAPAAPLRPLTELPAEVDRLK